MNRRPRQLLAAGSKTHEKEENHSPSYVTPWLNCSKKPSRTKCPNTRPSLNG
jgi:hypothetical protein